MSMRSQVYAWNGANNNTALANNAATAYGTFNNLSGTQISIFIGGFGNNITKPAETTATEFVVIEDVSCTPSLNANAGVATNDIAGVTAGAGAASNGVGNAAAQLNTGQLATWQLTNNLAAGGNYTGCSAGVFGPVAYTGDWGKAAAGLAGIVAGDAVMNGIDFNAFCKYTLYDGPDALIANKLLEMGISINPGNVDWYKRSLLSSQGM